MSIFFSFLASEARFQDAVESILTVQMAEWYRASVS